MHVLKSDFNSLSFSNYVRLELMHLIECVLNLCIFIDNLGSSRRPQLHRNCVVVGFFNTSAGLCQVLTATATPGPRCGSSQVDVTLRLRHMLCLNINCASSRHGFRMLRYLFFLSRYIFSSGIQAVRLSGTHLYGQYVLHISQ